MMRALRWL